MDIVLIKLFLAHLIGDFFLQSDKWVREKEREKLKSSKLYYHSLIHGILPLILLWDFGYWLTALAITIAHFGIDALKLYIQKPKTKRLWFFADQIMHILSLIIVWSFIANSKLDLTFLNQTKFWINLAAVLALTLPSSIIIKVLIAKWTPDTTDLGSSRIENSLQSAGQYIGIMERLLVFIFVCTNHFEAIGFLIAAKSIFRFGDLKEGKELKLTEYILIGTLLSFGIAICVSLLAFELGR